MKTKLLSFSLALVAALTTGCGQESLTKLDTALDLIMGYGTVDAHFCTSPPSPAQQYLKYLFIVDHAASNQPGFPITAGVEMDEDPSGARRYGPMVNFIQNLAPDPNNITSFGLIDFNDSATLPGNLTNLEGFDPSASDFISIATTDWIGNGTSNSPLPVDGGFTNYQSALQLAFQLIQQDVEADVALHANPIIATQYVIIFVSDGEPIVAAPGSTPPIYTQTFATDISPVISQIMGLKTSPTYGPYIANITLNTAYYYNTTPDVAGETLLQQMATQGNGLYVQFGNGQNVLYQEFTPPSRDVVNQLADVFIENENAVWWDNGQFMADSDGDGLPDLIETQLGSNPYLADSDGNGVSDLVEYRTKGTPCQDAACKPSNRDPYAMCAGFSPVTSAANIVTFGSSANDGLNDCEKYLLGGVVGSFSSNGDLIPDEYAFKNTLPILPNTANVAFSDPFGDGVSNYDKLKDGLPIQVSDKVLYNFTTRSTELTIESQPSPQVTCYHLHVSHVALSATANTMKVMVVQNGAGIQDKPFLMISEKTVDASNNEADFVATDFH
jgi:hypothetical protein